VPSDAAVPLQERDPALQYRDLCGQACATARLNRWLDTLKQIYDAETARQATESEEI